jgi:predicted permease
MASGFFDSLRVAASRIRGIFTRRRIDEDFRQELDSHLALLAEENIRRGMSPEEAHRSARVRLGGVTQLRESNRELHCLPWIETLAQDLRYAFRMLRKNPGSSAVAVLTLALGIGANTAVYSLVDTILLRPLPYRHPEQLVVVSETEPQMGGDTEVGMAAGEYLDYRDRNRSFTQTAAYEAAGFNLTGAGTPLRVNAAAVTASVFPLLGVTPRLGHTFTADDERPGSTPVAVLSYSMWRDHFGADVDILNKTIKLDEQPYIVAGVMPPSFQFPSDGAPLSERVDLWVPEVFAPDRLQDRLREFGVHFIGRLKPGVTAQLAQADVSNIAAAFMQQYHYSGTLRVVPHVHPFAAYEVQKARPLLMLLIAAVAYVLLIACANVANLLLARGSQRSHEMAIRSAIGAARRRLLGQCLTESVLLSIFGAGAGFALAVLLVAGVQTFGPADVPRLQDVALNPSALLFTVALSLLATVLFGFVPAWRLSQTSPQDSLKETSQAGQARATQRLQSLIAVAEIAMALVLLIGGGLVLQSFVRVLSVPLGFRPQNAFILRTLFDEARYPDPVKRAVMQKQLIEGVRRLSGVEVVAAASHLPLSDSRQIGFLLEHAAPDDFHWAENSLVSPGYFQTMGIPILRGRDFTAQDRPDTPLAAIINETLARQYFPGQDALGKRFYWGGRPLFTIVGIASDVHISALDADTPPMIYHSMFQVQTGASERTALVVRLAPGRHNQDLFHEIQQQAWQLDRGLPVYDFNTLEALISESVAQRRFTTVLLLAFALTALALALIGLFGVMSYLVAQRRREMAIRMALGASRQGVYWAVMKRGAALAMAGCALGLAVFPLGGRLMVTTLFHTSAYDPVTLLAVPALLMMVALAASYIPARRATMVDPMVALRHE